MQAVTDRFIRYARQLTTSNPESSSFPSSDGQKDFAEALVAELKTIGMEEAEMDGNGYVMATLPSNFGNAIVPVIGFVSHMDTSPDFNGENVNPILHPKYQGSPIQLNNNLVISPEEFPELKNYIGQDILTADGTSLLGADDKAGIAAIVTAMEYLINHPEIPHGKIRVGFTPDEEIGKGADRFDVGKFGASFAYTVDGGEIGELEFENFNASIATVKIAGRSVHPGSAKNKMVNAALVGHAFISMIPPGERPELTENYEGFYHLIKFSGTVEKAELHYLIRDHNPVEFEKKKRIIREITGLLNLKFGDGTVKCEIIDQYFNMRQKIEPVMHIVNLAEKAMLMAGVEPRIRPVRGGTDGARLSYEGLPCPNLFTGGHNFHGPYEFIPVQSMEKAVKVIVNICKLATGINP